MPAEYVHPDELPYGPGNPDYEHDGRDDDAEAWQHEQDLLRQQQETHQ